MRIPRPSGWGPGTGAGSSGGDGDRWIVKDLSNFYRRLQGCKVLTSTSSMTKSRSTSKASAVYQDSMASLPFFDFLLCVYLALAFSRVALTSFLYREQARIWLE